MGVQEPTLSLAPNTAPASSSGPAQKSRVEQPVEVGHGLVLVLQVKGRAGLVQQGVENVRQPHHLPAAFRVVVDVGAPVGVQAGVAAPDRYLVGRLALHYRFYFVVRLDGIVENLPQHRAVHHGDVGVEANGLQVTGHGFRQARLVNKVGVAGEGQDFNFGALKAASWTSCMARFGS